MSKSLRNFISDCNSGLGRHGLMFARLKRGKVIIVPTPYTKNGQPKLKAQAHLKAMGVRKGWS